MGIFGFFKRNTLKAIQWLDDSKNTIVYRFPMDGRSITWGSKLTVRESQVAIFVNKGKLADVFGPGIYHLSTSNLPILTELLSLPFGFKSPFYAEVYFINTKQFTNQKWGTSNPITMRDKDFGTIRIKGYGTYAYKVLDPQVFLNELFGTNSTFSTDDIANYFKSMLVSCISDTIAESKISALDLACNLEEFNQTVKERMAEKFASLGLNLTNFVIENLSFPEQVEKAIDARSSMGVLEDKMDTYVKYQTVHAMRDAAKNPGGNMSSAGVGLGAGMAMGNMMSEMLKSSSSKQDKQEQANTKFCPECGTKIKATAKFCPECGAKIGGARCPKCNQPVRANAKFCPNCGEKLK